jgi:hypothetical protein
MLRLWPANIEVWGHCESNGHIESLMQMSKGSVRDFMPFFNGYVFRMLLKVGVCTSQGYEQCSDSSKGKSTHIKTNMRLLRPSFSNGLTILIPSLLTYIACIIIARVTSSFVGGLGEVFVTPSLGMVVATSSCVLTFSSILGFDTRIQIAVRAVLRGR